MRDIVSPVMFPVPGSKFKIQSKRTGGLPQTLSNGGDSHLHLKPPPMSSVQSNHADCSSCDMTLTNGLSGIFSYQHTSVWTPQSLGLST